MPISEIQVKVLRLIAGNRSPESYLAGATVIHRGDNTPRYSRDLDFKKRSAASTWARTGIRSRPIPQSVRSLS